MRRTILIADDERENRDVLAEVFERQGYPVRLAPNGEEALRIAERTRLGLAILDYEMPRMDGLETLRILHRNVESLPVLMMSSDLSEQLKERAAAFGVKGFFEKPIDVGHLREQVARLIGEERSITVYRMTTTLIFTGRNSG